MSDAAQAQTDEVAELGSYARQLWASEDYQGWQKNVQRAVADGTIYDEPPLSGSGT